VARKRQAGDILKPFGYFSKISLRRDNEKNFHQIDQSWSGQRDFDAGDGTITLKPEFRRNWDSHPENLLSG
jgi:hypothetical protein